MTLDTFSGIFACTAYQGNEAYKRALYAQAFHETGNFTSNLYKNYYNMFGMSPSSIRTKYWSDKVTLGGHTYATYEDQTYQQSLIDRVDLDEFNKIQIPGNNSEVADYFADVVAHGYATDPLYLSKVINIYNQLFPEYAITQEEVDDSATVFGINFANLGWPILLLLPVAGYFVYKWLKDRF